MEAMTKNCTKCKTEFPKDKDHFYFKNDKVLLKSGKTAIYTRFSSHCKKCQNTYLKNYCSENPEKRKATLIKSQEKQKVKYHTDKAFNLKRKESCKKYNLSGKRPNYYKLRTEHYKSINKAYSINNKPKIRLRMKKWRDNLADGYIASKLKKSISNLNPEIIETKRLIIQLKRELIKIK